MYKNRGRFLFTFPHPSSNEGNEGVNPQAERDECMGQFFMPCAYGSVC
jgi:hypothetical protein